MGAAYRRPRVYVQFRHRGALIRRVLDIAFLHGTDPVAVISWVKRDGEVQAGEYVHLEERALHPAVPAGMYRYDRVIDDPRFAPPAVHIPEPEPAVASADAAENGEGIQEKA